MSTGKIGIKKDEQQKREQLKQVSRASRKQSNGCGNIKLTGGERTNAQRTCCK
jgi:hypothetical protein